MALDQIIRHGSDTVKLPGETTTRRWDGLDNVTQDWISSDDSLFQDGDSMPGYSNIRIEEVQRTTEAGDYRYRLNGIGLVASKGTRIETGYPKITHNLEGLDEASLSVITSNENYLEIGDTLSGYANMFCVSVGEDEIYDGFYRLQGRYLGLIGSKPYKRTITVNGQVVNPTNLLTVGYTGGWSIPSTGQFSIPRIVVSDFRVQNGGPPTDNIPGRMTPPDAPDVASMSWTGEITRIWPNGWIIAAFNGSFIAGTDIWAGEYVYEYVFDTLPA